LAGPGGEVHRELGSLPWEGLLGTADALVAAALTALFLGRRMTRSVGELADRVEAIGRGDFDVGMGGPYGDKVGRLAAALRHMARDLRVREQALEGRVEARTRELAEVRTTLGRQQALQRLILESIGEGVVVTDREGRFLLWNHRAEEIIGRGVALAPEDWAQYYEVRRRENGVALPAEELPLVRALHGESSDRVELFLRPSSDGAGRWVMMSGRPMRGPDGAVEGGVVTVVDTTEARHLWGRLQDHRAELAKVGRLALIGEIASDTAHQISQPLAAISNYTGAALQLSRSGRLEQARLHEILDSISRMAGRAGGILDNLRSLIRRRPQARTCTDLNQVIGSCLQTLEERIGSQGVGVTQDLAPALPVVSGDPIELEQMFMHLVINALEALSEVPLEQRRLGIGSRYLSEQGVVRVEVRDSGPGVSPEIALCLFQPWVTAKQEGLGIGLSIARGVVSAHDGKIWWERRAEGETVFMVELPVPGDASV